MKNNNKKVLSTCSECGMSYEDKEWADKCEQWCKEHKNCNVDIIQYAITQQ